MIIVRVPLRISFCGGGTDFEDYYRIHNGCVISTTIDKYIYITLTEKFDDKINLRYSQTEVVDTIDQLQHDIVREALRRTKITHGVEMVTISDIPGKGSGLGSSSALSVGLMHILYTFKGHKVDPRFLAEEACGLEIDILHKPIGKQDQYAVAHGGLNMICFHNERIGLCCQGDRVEVVNLYKEVDYNKLRWLEQATMLFYLGMGRDANDILQIHTNNISNKIEVLHYQQQLATQMENWFQSDSNNMGMAGHFVNESWKCKKMITPEATNDEIDGYIYDVIHVGADGAKVCGAGGGGFLMVICDPSEQHQVRSVLSHLKEMKFNFTRKGSEIIYTNGLPRL